MKILAIDLGKYKSVACNYVTATGTARFATVVTHANEFDRLLSQESPDLVVIETCSIAGWVHDLCCQRGVKCQVANPSSEAWKWKNVKRKTDRDDALKLAQLAALEQLPTVHVPAPETRQRRALLKYRQSLITRRVAIQNHLRAIAQRQGILLDRGSRAWTEAGFEVIQQLAKPLEQCSADELWRGEAALELQALRGGHQAAARSGTQARSVCGIERERQVVATVSPALDVVRRRWSWPTWTTHSGLRMGARSLRMQDWCPNSFNRARPIAEAASVAAGRLCCERCWSKRAGSCCVTTRGPSG